MQLHYQCNSILVKSWLVHSPSDSTTKRTHESSSEKYCSVKIWIASQVIVRPNEPMNHRVNVTIPSKYDLHRKWSYDQTNPWTIKWTIWFHQNMDCIVLYTLWRNLLVRWFRRNTSYDWMSSTEVMIQKRVWWKLSHDVKCDASLLRASQFKEGERLEKLPSKNSIDRPRFVDISDVHLLINWLNRQIGIDPWRQRCMPIDQLT